MVGERMTLRSQASEGGERKGAERETDVAIF